jgi:hypothetical protein
MSTIDQVKEAIDFVVDIESNRLPSGVSSRQFRGHDGHIGNVSVDITKEEHVKPIELSILDKDKRELTALTFSDIHTPETHDLNINGVYDGYGIFNGKKQKVKIFTGTTQTKSDIEKLFKSANAKGKTLKQAEVDHYFNKVFKHISSRLESMETYYEVKGEQGRHALISSFSNRYFKTTVNELHRISIENISKFVNVSKKSKVMQLDEFQSKYVNEFAKTIIDSANSKGVVNIGAWNAQFELERISGWVSMYAKDSIRNEWFKNLNSGAIKFKGMESSYVNVMYGLAKEDKSILSAMRIPLTPEAYHQHGYRAGMTPRNKIEFESALPWSQDLVTSAASSWLKGIKQTTGIAAHDAPIDTIRADMLKTFFDKVQNEAIDIINKNRTEKLTTMDSFFESLHAENTNGRTVMHEAFNNVLKREYGAGEVLLNGKSTKDILEQFKDVIRSTSTKRSEIIKDILEHINSVGGGGGGGRKPPINGKGFSEFFSGMSKNNKYGYGILAALAGIAFASTYLTTENDYNGGYGSSFGKIGNRKQWNSSFNFEDGDNNNGPYLHHNINSFLYNVIGAYGGVSLIGYRASKLNGKLFGLNSDINIKNPKELAKNSFKLFKYGVREIEDHFPITRVFKASSAIEYITGSITSKSNINKGFNSTFKNIDNPNLIGDIEINSFLDAINISNPDAASTLKSVMENFNGSSKVKKAKLNIRSLGKHTSVQIEYETSDKIVKQAFVSPLIFDVETGYVRTDRANTRGRGVHPSIRKLDNASNRVRSSMAHDYIDSERFRLGKYKIKNFEEFESQFSKPLWVNDVVYSLFRKAQYHLELGPKGINQNENIFIKSTIKNRSPKGVVVVKNIGGEATPLESLRIKARYYGKFGNNFIQAANNFLESPFELMLNPQTIERVTSNLLNSRNPLSRVSGKILKIIEHPHLGLNINNMKYGAPEYLLKFGLKRVLPTIAAYYGIKTLDSILGGLMFTNTGRGPITSAPNILYQKASLAYSKVSDILGLTTIAKKQEEYAPGSTGMGFFAIPITLMGTYTIAQGIYNKSPQHLQQFLHKEQRVAKSSLAKDIFSRFSESSLYKEVMRKEVYKGALNKSILARATETLIEHPRSTLFGVGVALMSPFLLGFLGSSKSYQERKAEFAGQKDVAIRKNRGWLMSGQAIGGENIQQFRQHGSYIYQSNYENRGVIWPSYTSRLLHAMTLGLTNRYVLEEYHKESQPVYESAPYGASVPIVGPIISKTLGWLAKPIRRMHTETVTGFSGNDNYTPRYIQIARQGAMDRKDENSPYYSVLDNKLPNGIRFSDLASHSNIKQHTSSLFSQIAELVGFRGFVTKAIYQSISGKDQPDSYTPYLKSAMEMYNPSQFMWQYQAGDFSYPGGEFMRRGLQNPRKRWEIDNIPNELYGQSWLPKKYQTGTTFDKMPMGWLYASKKGWEFQYDGLKGMDLEDYPDNIKLDILKYMAPNSKEFSLMSQQVNRSALNNTLTPFEEQRAYDAVEQRALLEDKLGATSRKNIYALKEQELNGVITSLDLSNMTFTLDNQGSRKYRLAGISVDANDIRNKLLKENHYNNAEDLAKDADKRQEEIINLIEKQMSVGSRITINVADTDNGNFSGGGNTEAIVGSLNRKLIEAGSPLINTGNLSQYNLSQESKPVGSGILSLYWEGITKHTNVLGRKLLGSSDYLQKYKHEQVYNRKVKLWNKPIEHFLLPLVSSVASSLGFSVIPASVKHERATEQYWDIIKYIKYKKLQGQAETEDEAEYYASLSESTLVGADPINNSYGAKQALSYNKQDYFDYFANEPDAKKRGKIMSVVSNAEKRIYSSIWTANLAKSGNKNLQEKYKILQETGGYDIDKKTLESFKKEAGDDENIKEYVRARYISQYLKSHKLPGLNWEGWDKNVDIDNVEVHSLLSEGEQVQDYGYFEQQKRQAAYDKGAYLAAQHINSSRLTSSEFTGTVLPMLMTRTGISSANSLPTDSQFSISSSSITTDTYSKNVSNMHNMPAYTHGGISNYFL